MDKIFQRLLPLRLRAQKPFFLFQKCAVATLHAKRPVRINAVQLNHGRGNILKKIAVMTHDHAGECGLFQQLFEPLDSCQVKVIGGFVEQQYIRRFDQRLDNGKPLLPAARERSGCGFEVFKPGAAQGFSKASAALRFGDGSAQQCSLDHRAHRILGAES